MAAGLGVDGLDVEAPFERVDDEVPQAVGDGRGVGIDDHEHAPPRPLGGGLAHAQSALHRLARAVTAAESKAVMLSVWGIGYTAPAARHSWTHPEGWRDWPVETPATSRVSGDGANSIRLQQRPGRCGEVPVQDLRHSPAEVFSYDGRELKCRECGARYPLEALYVCERCFGPSRSDTTTATSCGTERRARCRGAAPQDPGRAPEPLALRGLPAARRRSPGTVGAARLARRAAGRLHAADPRRPAGRGAGPARGVGQERRRQPHPLLQGPRRLGRGRAGPGARLRDDRLRLDRQPRQLGGRRTAAALGLESYVFIPHDLEEQKVLATGVYGTHLVSVRGNYDDVNRLCTELSRRARTGRSSTSTCGPTTPRARRRSRSRSPSSSAGSSPTAASCRSPRARCSRRSPRASRSGSTLGLLEGSLPRMNGAQAEGCAPVASAFAAGHDCLPAGQAGHDRQARSRSATRPTAPTRSSSRAAAAARRRGQRRGDPRGHRPVGAHDRDLHRDGRRRDRRPCSRSSPTAARSTPTSGSCW